MRRRRRKKMTRMYKSMMRIGKILKRMMRMKVLMMKSGTQEVDKKDDVGDGAGDDE